MKAADVQFRIEYIREHIAEGDTVMAEEIATQTMRTANRALEESREEIAALEGRIDELATLIGTMQRN